MNYKYKKFIDKVTEQLNECFEEQKDFIKCGLGCDLCCKDSYYSASKVEYEYLRQGLIENYPEEKLKEIKDKCIEIVTQKQKHLAENKELSSFIYECPLLEEKKCILYEYRPFICRIFGIIYTSVTNPEAAILPECINKGLNYSNIFDFEKQMFSEEKIKELGIDNEPKCYHLSELVNMADGVEMKDYKLLVEWIAQDNYF